MKRIITLALVIGITGCRSPNMIVTPVQAQASMCPTTMVYVYKAGTHTFVPIYADPDMQMLMTNPFLPNCDKNKSFEFYTTARAIRVVEAR